MCRHSLHGRSLATSAAIGEYVAAAAIRGRRVESARPPRGSTSAGRRLGGSDGREVGVRARADGLRENFSYGAARRRVDALGRRNPGRVVVLVPTRELVAQHETLLNALGATTAVVTSATLGAPGGAEALADAIEASAVVLATPAELCQVLEHRPSLYGALRCEALVCDELDLLMPSRKSNGAKVTRWQDRGDHPAEALAKLAAKRCGSSLQVLAGSATLDRASKTKLERALKGAPKVALPLPVVACDAGKNLVVKTKRAPGRPGNVRTTIAPKRVVHRSSTKADAVAGAADALSALKPRVALVFVCGSSKLKVRAVAEDLGARVLNDALFPSSARSRRRNYATKSSGEKKALEAAEKATDADKRAAATRDAAEQLRADVAAATAEAPVVLVASEDRARGLDIAGVEAVLILGGPANADTFVLPGKLPRTATRSPATFRRPRRPRPALSCKRSGAVRRDDRAEAGHRPGPRLASRRRATKCPLFQAVTSPAELGD